MKATPFHLKVSEEELADLRQRLSQTLWLKEMQGIGASEGIREFFRPLRAVETNKN